MTLHNASTESDTASPPSTQILSPSARTIERPASPQSSKHQKLCTLCSIPRSVLVRCRIDPTQKWHFVCPGKCWKKVSGGVQDGVPDKPWYQYGGMWKDKHEAVSARMKTQNKRNSWKKSTREASEKNVEASLEQSTEEDPRDL